MEKRRRARINCSLAELKALLLEAIKKEGARQNKMEKADILEMAVRHLRHVQEQPQTGQAPGDPDELTKYNLGFRACVQEVCKYLDSNGDEDLALKTKLLNHLATCMTNASFQSTSSSIPSSSADRPRLSTMVVGSPSPSASLFTSAKSAPAESSDGVSSPLKTQTPARIEEKIFPGPERDSTMKTPKPQEGILHAVLTTPAKPVLVKTQTVSLSGAEVLSNPSHAGVCSSLSDNFSINVAGGGGSNQLVAVREINNNTITLPTFINMGASPTAIQPQLQQPQLPQQQHHVTQPQLQQPTQYQVFHDNSNFITNLNQFQLIPTKTANGDIAFLLSATNPAQFQSLSIPVLASQTVSHAQVLSPSIPQPAANHIAFSFKADEQNQPITLMPRPDPPHSTNQRADITMNASQQTTPLNLSSTTYMSAQTSHQLMPKETVVLSNVKLETSDRVLHPPNQNMPASSVSYQSQTSNPSHAHSQNSNRPAHGQTIRAGQLTQICSPNTLSVLPTVTQTLLVPASLAPATPSGTLQWPSNVCNQSESSSPNYCIRTVLPEQPITATKDSSAPMSNDYLKNRYLFRPWKE